MSENTNENPVETSAIEETLEVTGQQMDATIQNKSISQKYPNIAEFMEQSFKKFDIGDDNYLNLAEKSVVTIKEDELIKGKIVEITKDEVLVDINFKSYGVVPKAELINAESYNVGEEIDVYIERVEDISGHILLSRRRADFMRIWEDILALHTKQEITRVKILRRIKGGMVVDLLGIEAFLPGSQIDVRPVRDFDEWVSKSIDVKVVKVNHPYENVVVSHKVLLEEHLAEQRQAIMNKLEKGLVLEGIVKAVSDFGVFVDLGGVDGLVHITDLSWGRVMHPSEVVELDSTVRVVVLDFDEEKKRISLGMKQLTPHPWDNIGEKYVVGTKVEGKVVSLTEYGAFIEIEKGIEGLIHISEMSWTQHVRHPSQIVQMGNIIEAIVLSIDKDDKKLALGMKQLTPDPWEDLIKRFPVDSKHNGIVRNLTNFGVFVELEPGVDGLVHISDLSWTKKIRHPGEFVKRGDELSVVVLTVDPEQRRIALGHKQMSENPWDKFEETYKIGTETEAKIERIIEKGVIIELPQYVDGFVPVSQLSFAPVRVIRDYFNVGDILPLKVVEFDKDSKKIVLSVVECLRGKDQSVIDEYNQNHPVPNADRYSAGSELPEDVPVYQPGDKEIDEVIKQEFSYPDMPEDMSHSANVSNNESEGIINELIPNETEETTPIVIEVEKEAEKEAEVEKEVEVENSTAPVEENNNDNAPTEVTDSGDGQLF
jgi:small subunit ribosomal protein S1